MKVILENLNYPFRIIYYGEDFNKYPREDFPQEQTSFLKLYGRNFDAFNIQADSLKIRENFLLQKENLYIRKNALNVWIYNKNPKEQNKFTREDFFNEYPFSFCISKQEINSLPFFIKKDILKYIKDDKTGVFFYILDNSKKIKNAAPK
jgi:CRISPR/Cas system CSM-associated protein Csm4 (group 5 of RAMP superfamily)